MNVQLSNAPASHSPAADVATKVATAMRAMGVVGHPRNYEIFYEVFTGSNQSLNAEFAALGSKPRQHDLDAISVKYFIQSSNQLFVDNVREQIANKVEEVMILFEKERLQVERYGSILSQSSDGLKARSNISNDLLQRIAGIMAQATDSKIEQGRQFVTSMMDKSSELEEVKSKLEEYKKLADTDPMTQLCNRRAFDRAIATVYDEPRKVMFSALVVADIDRFKQINDRFGHPVGDKIIQHVAGIIRLTASSDMVVARTGGEEFAVIVPGLKEDAVFDFAETIRKGIERLVPLNGQTGVSENSITVSVGICMAAQASNAEDLYSKADRALYFSKASGRNQSTRFSALPEPKASKNWLLYKRD